MEYCFLLLVTMAHETISSIYAIGIPRATALAGYSLEFSDENWYCKAVVRGSVNSLIYVYMA